MCNRLKYSTSASVEEAVPHGCSLDTQETKPDARTKVYPMAEHEGGVRTPPRVQVRRKIGKWRVIRLELRPEVRHSLDVRQDTDDGGPARVVRPRGVAAQSAHGVAKVGLSPKHGIASR